MTVTASSMASLASSCVGHCFTIIDLLEKAEGNDKEHTSLLVAVRSIHGFLVDLPAEGITQQGNNVLTALTQHLRAAEELLQYVFKMGPLASLFKARFVRQEFLRINRDITSVFSILASGEQLVHVVQSRSEQKAKEMADIRAQLHKAETEFFTQEEAAYDWLCGFAKIGKEGDWSDQMLQAQLRKKLQALPQYNGLQPQQLLEEYRALQMMMIYNGPAAAGGDHRTAKDQGKLDNKKTGIDEEVEEFLLQQVCAALAATVASTTGEPLTSDAVAVPPEEFLCPISKQLMVDPVELVGTGRRYDAANIMHWLATHDTCPITRKKLSNKEVTPDRALKKAAEAWAASHGVALPPVPRYTPLHPEHGSATTGGAGAAGSTSYGPSEAAGEFRVDNMPGNKGQGACSCTRRKWAFTIVGLLLSAAAVAAGVGISMAKNKQEQLSGTAKQPGTAAAPPSPGQPQSPSAKNSTGPGDSSPLAGASQPGGNNDPEWLVAVGDSFSNWGVADLECGAERVCVFSTNSVSNVAQECAKRTDCVGFEMRKYPVPSGHLKKESPLKQAGPSDKSYPTRSTYCIANRSQLCTTVDLRFNWRYYPRTDIKGESDYVCARSESIPDVVSGELKDCFVKGPVIEVAAACRADTKCASFVATPLRVENAAPVEGGFLKIATKPRSDSPYADLYVKL